MKLPSIDFIFLLKKYIVSGNLETGVKGESRKNQTWFKDCLLVGLLSGYDGLTMKEVEVVWGQEMFKGGSLGFSDTGTWSRPLTK